MAMPSVQHPVAFGAINHASRPSSHHASCAWLLHLIRRRGYPYHWTSGLRWCLSSSLSRTRFRRNALAPGSVAKSLLAAKESLKYSDYRQTQSPLTRHASSSSDQRGDLATPVTWSSFTGRVFKVPTSYTHHFFHSGALAAYGLEHNAHHVF